GRGTTRDTASPHRMNEAGRRRATAKSRMLLTSARDPGKLATRTLQPMLVQAARGRPRDFEGTRDMKDQLKANVLIVGGTGGIGRALAERYASLGSDVVITSRSAERAAATAAEIGPNVRGIALDIAHPEKIAEMLAEL